MNDAKTNELTECDTNPCVMFHGKVELVDDRDFYIIRKELCRDCGKVIKFTVEIPQETLETIDDDGCFLEDIEFEIDQIVCASVCASIDRPSGGSE